MGPLSRIGKGLEDIKNLTADVVELLVDDFVTLVEKAMLLLGQTSLSVTFGRRLNILKHLLKDLSKKAKTLLREKSHLTRE